MNTITVKNLSTFIDSAALVRVAHLIAGDEYHATHDADGGRVVRIAHKGNTYTVTNADENGDGKDVPEYLDFRCCMCPNTNNPQNTVCPPGGAKDKPETPCRFVKTYIDGQGRFVSVMSSRKSKFWFIGRRETEQAPARRVNSSLLPICEAFDRAQTDLNKYAKLKGWRENI